MTLRLKSSLRLAQIPGHDLRGALVVERVDDSLGVADPLGNLAELADEGEAFGNCVWRTDGSQSAVKRVGERSRVCGAAGKLDRLSAQAVAASTRVLVAKHACQAGE